MATLARGGIVVLHGPPGAGGVIRARSLAARMPDAALTIEDLTCSRQPLAEIEGLAPGPTIVVTTRRVDSDVYAASELKPLSSHEAIELFHAASNNALRDHDAEVAEIVELLDRLPDFVVAVAQHAGLGPTGILDSLRSDASLVGPALRSFEVAWARLDSDHQRLLHGVSVFQGAFRVTRAAGMLKVTSDALLRALLAAEQWHLICSAGLDEQGYGRFLMRGVVRTSIRRSRPADANVQRRYISDQVALETIGVADLPDQLWVASQSNAKVRMEMILRSEEALHRVGRAAELVAHLSAAEELPPGGLRARARARRITGDIDGADEDLTVCLELSDPPAARAAAFRELGTLMFVRGELEKAKSAYQRAYELYVLVGDRRAAALVLDGLAATEYVGGATDSARKLSLRALRILVEVGDRSAEGMVRGHLGLIALDRGLVDEARVQLNESRQIHHRLGRVRFEAADLANLALVALDTGDLDTANTHLNDALALYRSAGDRRGVAFARLDLGVCAEEAGRLAIARLHYLEALDIGRLIDARRLMGLALTYLGRLSAREGREQDARASFLDASEHLRSRDEQALLAVCRAHLGGAVPSLDHPTVTVRSALRILELERRRMVLTIDELSQSWALQGRSSTLINRPTLWRVMLRLVRQHEELPGSPVSRHELFVAGWPGERISDRSAAGRVRTAVYALRQMGLSDAIANVGGGYALQPTLRIEHGSVT